MIEIQCPNCSRVLEVNINRDKVICKKCLEDTGKRFIMVEANSNPNYKNMGDGFFQKED